MKNYTIRREVINASYEQWDLLSDVIINGVFIASVDTVKNSVGVFGCLTAKANDEELEFFKLLHAQK